MKLGICLRTYGRPIEIGRMLEVARRAEDRGLDSVWVTDHVIRARSRPTSSIRRAHARPSRCSRGLAGVTSRVALATSVVILPYRSLIPWRELLPASTRPLGGRFCSASGAAIVLCVAE